MYRLEVMGVVVGYAEVREVAERRQARQKFIAGRLDSYA